MSGNTEVTILAATETTNTITNNTENNNNANNNRNTNIKGNKSQSRNRNNKNDQTYFKGGTAGLDGFFPNYRWRQTINLNSTTTWMYCGCVLLLITVEI